MLKVQQFLIKHGLEKLKKKYKIKVIEHKDGRILLNYDQIDSPKTAEITRECRGLCLHKDDFRLISRSFRRFFNFGEWRADDNAFDWGSATATYKEDGTLISVYWYNNKWQVQTRGSFGDIPINNDGPTFEELFWKATDHWHINQLHKEYSYTFELCSRYNKIVRDYPTPSLYLLSSFKGAKELPYRQAGRGRVNVLTYAQHFNTLQERSFYCIEDVQAYIRDVSKKDKTFEGFVLRDRNNIRLKVKNPDYIALHRMAGASGNVFLPKNLIGFVLSGEVDELLQYYPETKEKVKEMQLVLEEAKQSLLTLWHQLNVKPLSRKEFALSIPKDFKLKSFLFRMLDGENFNEMWKNEKDFLLETLF